MSDIRSRLVALIKYKGIKYPALENLSGIKSSSWKNIGASRQRVNGEHIEFCVREWPQYAYWVTTGKTIEESGQISPTLDQEAKKSKQKKDTKPR